MKGSPLLILLALAGCGSAATISRPSAVPKFVPNDVVGNSATFSKLVRQLCIENGNDRVQFAQAIKATNWGFAQTQTLDPKNPYSVDVWKAPDAQVVHGKLAGDEILVCNVAVASGVADTKHVARALSALAKAPRKDAEWRWRQGAEEYVMDFSQGSDPATAFQVNVEIWRLPWWRRMLG